MYIIYYFNDNKLDIKTVIIDSCSLKRKIVKNQCCFSNSEIHKKWEKMIFSFFSFLHFVKTHKIILTN